MARPPKEGLDYFPHDVHATDDPKIQSLMALHGIAGYGFYFIMLSRVFRAENGRITCGKPAEKAGLARTMCLKLKDFEAILVTALDVGLFDKALYEAEQVLTSAGVQKRLEKIKSERERERLRKEKHKDSFKEEKIKRKGKGKPDAENRSFPGGKLKEEKEGMGDKPPDRKFIPPTIEEVTAYCLERGKGIDPEKWINHYTANGWKVGKNPMKDWRAAVRTWEPGKDEPGGIDLEKELARIAKERGFK